MALICFVTYPGAARRERDEASRDDRRGTPRDVLVPDPQQLAVTIGPMFRTNPQVRSRLLIFLAVLQSDPDEAAPDPHYNRPSRAPHERVQAQIMLDEQPEQSA